jgi:hypothetical protein
MVIKDAVKLTVEFLATLFLLQTTDYRSLAFKVVFCCSSSPIAVLGTATILHPGLVALDSRVPPPPHNQHPENLGLLFGSQLLLPCLSICEVVLTQPLRCCKHEIRVKTLVINWWSVDQLCPSVVFEI